MVQTQVLWVSSLEPWPKILSDGPASVNLVRAAGKGLLLQSMGSAGGTGCSTVRLPSISKLPTVLPADVTRFATGTPIRSSSREAVMIDRDSELHSSCLFLPKIASWSQLPQTPIEINRKIRLCGNWSGLSRQCNNFTRISSNFGEAGKNSSTAAGASMTFSRRSSGKGSHWFPLNDFPATPPFHGHR